MTGTEPALRYMAEAIALGRKGIQENDGGPFGAVVVCGAEIVGRDNNRVTTSCDPTAHAEILAIRDACRSLGRFELRGCAIYTSCEPCPMCLAAIYWARLEKIFYACTRRDAAQIGFDDHFLYEELPREIDARSLPMQQLARPEALALFQEWTAKPDKILY